MEMRFPMFAVACRGWHIDDSFNEFRLLDFRMGRVDAFELSAREPVAVVQGLRGRLCSLPLEPSSSVRLSILPWQSSLPFHLCVALHPILT